MNKEKKHFKYYPEDFGELGIKVHHMDLEFDIFSKKTHVISTIHLEALKSLRKVSLNAKDLDIKDIYSKDGSLKYKYEEKKDIIHITFSKTFKQGDKFTITTKTTCYPKSNILEGIYYDETPKGCPCQMITQCQQWGFQRIVPCIDDMTAKCTYTTTIKADKRYTNYISNGDVIKRIKPISKTRIEITYANHKTPMATYLFFLGVGTYKTFKREFEYPNGDTFMLELLVPPKSDREQGKKALKILHDSIMWVYLFTGPKKYENEKISSKIKTLIDEREKLKLENSNSKKLDKLREKISKLQKNHTFGYKYTGTVYREIAMQNSDFGGMENVGNTTISTNRIMPFNDMADPVFEYMIRVKVHEYYHNLNGSEVTGMTPFEIWLNEAVTVHIEREYHAYLFGERYSRFSEAQRILISGNGILASDSGVSSLPILPEGFNSPNDLITSITYVKAPEFVRMIQKTLGNENFVKALNDYHTKFKHSNATTSDWIEAMQQYTSIDLTSMAKQWLKKANYPILEINTKYDKKKKELTLLFNQKNASKKNFWSFPFKFAIMKKGKVLFEKQIHINSKESSYIVSGIKEYDFISTNRDLSFYGKVEYKQKKEEMITQILNDDNYISRYITYQKLFEQEKIRLLNNSNSVIDKEINELFGKLLNDKSLIKEIGGKFLPIYEYMEDKKYAYEFKKTYNVKNKILKELAKNHKKKLVSLYKKYSSIKVDSSNTFPNNEIENIKARQVKHFCLSVLSKLDTIEIHELIKEQISSNNASDKLLGIRLYNESSASDKNKVLHEYEKEASKNLVSWEIFLSIIGSNNTEHVVDMIKTIEKSKYFRVDQSNDQRALYVTFAMNKKISLETQKGRELLKEIIITLSKINENTLSRIMSVFGNLDEMSKENQKNLVKLLHDVLSNIDSKNSVITYNTIKRILDKSPKAVREFEKSLN